MVGSSDGRQRQYVHGTRVRPLLGCAESRTFVQAPPGGVGAPSCSWMLLPPFLAVASASASHPSPSSSSGRASVWAQCGLCRRWSCNTSSDNNYGYYSADSCTPSPSLGAAALAVPTYRPLRLPVVAAVTVTSCLAERSAYFMENHTALHAPRRFIKRAYPPSPLLRPSSMLSGAATSGLCSLRPQ